MFQTFPVQHLLSSVVLETCHCAELCDADLHFTVPAMTSSDTDSDSSSSRPGPDPGPSARLPPPSVASSAAGARLRICHQSRTARYRMLCNCKSTDESPRDYGGEDIIPEVDGRVPWRCFEKFVPRTLSKWECQVGSSALYASMSTERSAPKRSAPNFNLVSFFPPGIRPPQRAQESWRLFLHCLAEGQAERPPSIP